MLKFASRPTQASSDDGVSASQGTGLSTSLTVLFPIQSHKKSSQATADSQIKMLAVNILQFYQANYQLSLQSLMLDHLVLKQGIF